MATDLERLTVLIEANTRSYERSMLRLQQQTDKAIRGASKSIGTLDNSLKKVTRTARTMGAALGVSVGVGAFKQLASSIADTVHEADDLVDLADKLGITTDALQELQYQAKQNGSSTEDLNAALDQFSKRVGQAAAGSGELLKIFDQYGIELRDSAGQVRPLTDLLADYAELLKSTASEQERANLAAQAFKNLDMASVFGGGAEGIRKSAEEAHNFNQVVGEEGLRTLSGYEQEMVRLQGAWNTAWTQMTVITLSALEKIGQAEHLILDPIIDFLNYIQKSAEERAADAGTAAGRAIAKRFKGQKSSAAANDRINQAFGDIGIAPAPAGDFAPLDPAVLDSISGSLNSLTDARESHIEAVKMETIALEDLSTVLETETVAQEQLIATLDEIRFASGSALSAFTDSIAAAQGPLEAMKASLVDILQTIIRIAEQQAIAKLFGAFGTAAPGILSGLPGIGSVAPAAAAAPASTNVHITAEPSPLLNLTITKSSQAAEERAIARGPVVARNNQMRYGIA